MLVMPPPRDSRDRGAWERSSDPVWNRLPLFVMAAIIAGVVAFFVFGIWIALAVFFGIAIVRGAAAGIAQFRAEWEAEEPPPRRDPDSGSRLADDLAHRGDIDGLVALLDSDDFYANMRAQTHLRELKIARAHEPLLRNLSHELWYFRMVAFKTLGEMGDPSAADAIYAAALVETSFTAQCNAGDALTALGDPRAVSFYGCLLASRKGRPLLSTRGMRRRTLDGLATAFGADAIPAFEAVAEHAGMLERRSLRRSISALRDAYSTPDSSASR